MDPVLRRAPALCVLLVACVSVGCQTTKTKSAKKPQAEERPGVPSASLVRWKSHTLRPNDVVALILTLPKSSQTTPYRLQTGDRIQIEGIIAVQGASAATVAPDGTVSLPLVGGVPAAGRTAYQLAGELDRRYARYIRDPRIVVSPVAVGADADELLRAFSGGGRQGLEVTVDPGGMINLPRLGAVRAGGRSADELSLDLTSRYGRMVTGVQVSVAIRSLAPRQAYVLGMVARPGPVDLRQGGTLVRAIATVGGWTLGANLEQVVVFRRGAQGSAPPKPIVMNIKALSRGRAHGWTDVPLAPGDLVVVPKTAISNFDDFVDQVFVRGVYGILPFSPDVYFYTR